MYKNKIANTEEIIYQIVIILENGRKIEDSIIIYLTQQRKIKNKC